MKKSFLNQLNGSVLSKDQLKSITGSVPLACNCGGFYISCTGICSTSPSGVVTCYVAGVAKASCVNKTDQTSKD